MSDTAPAAQEAAPGPIDYQPPADSQDALSIDDAMRLLSEPPKKEEQEAPEAPKAAEEPAEPAQADADPETDPGKAPEADEPAEELPPIEPPRSWTKEEKEAFAKWPREAQESMSRVASTREAEFRRSQNEAAEARKAIEAELSKAKQLQTEYEAKLLAPITPVAAVEQRMQSEFPDIKTTSDLEKLQQEDPFRFQRWQVLQAQWYGAKDEADRAQARIAKETENNWRTFIGEQTKKLAEFVPDAEVQKYAPKAGDLFGKLGFTDSEREGFLKGEKISPFDHRIQRIVLNALKYEDIQNAPKAVVKPNTPPVQRPGAKQPVGAAQAQSIQALNAQLNATGSLDDALALLMAQRKAS